MSDLTETEYDELRERMNTLTSDALYNLMAEGVEECGTTPTPVDDGPIGEMARQGFFGNLEQMMNTRVTKGLWRWMLDTLRWREKHDRVLELMTFAQDRIAAFARESYALHGRGLVMVTFPNVSPGTTPIVVSEVTYHDVADVHRLLDGDSEDEQITVRMVNTYDPDRQAAVMASIDGEGPVTVKMKLDKPNGQVH